VIEGSKCQAVTPHPNLPCFSAELELCGFGVFPSGSERTQGIQSVLKGFFFFTSSGRVEEFSATGEKRLLRFTDLLRDNALISL
jgi:hypothetical protein